ncbi:NAD-dependent epimerase/dehydratase family protein [Pectinatus frisingensis]|uniref:NAD-dependent epimerase/dehydratase family protein n=1 Tax=Pectinatus frisingensis TaxID=865 RepID=UPI0018C50D78|nr:NAD(P)-dependent oxidoreductase [Pectinatus frisingensis]
MKKILLTGGTGFIGRNIKEKLGKKYDILSPISKNLDLSDKKSVDLYIKKNNITDIIHCAVYNQKRRDIDVNADLSSNLHMFYNLAECAETLEGKMLYFGSGAEYDKRKPVHMAQEKNLGMRIPNLNDYSLSKHIMNLSARRSKNIYNLRLFGIFGKYENWCTCFISNLCCKAIYDLPLTVRQECVFDFMYIDDLIPVVEWFLENIPKYHDYNICTGKPVKLTQIAVLIKKISGSSGEIKLLSDGMNMEYTGSNRRIEQELAVKFSDREKAIQSLYYYYKKNFDENDLRILKDTR